MCIIVYKPKDIELPDINTLYNCYTNNPDGIGFMLLKNKVEIYKGFMTFEEFENTLREIDKKEDLRRYNVAFHFRIETSGGVKPELCHPFPIHIEKNKKDYIIDTVGIVHNGVLFSPKEKEYSDTYIFIRDILSQFNFRDKEIGKKLKTLENFIQNNKMVIFNSYLQEAYILNEYLGEWDKGIWYSNTSYRSCYYSTFYYKNPHTIYFDKDFYYNMMLEDLSVYTDIDKEVLEKLSYEDISEFYDMIDLVSKDVLLELLEEKLKEVKNV